MRSQGSRIAVILLVTCLVTAGSVLAADPFRVKATPGTTSDKVIAAPGTLDKGMPTKVVKGSAMERPYFGPLDPRTSTKGAPAKDRSTEGLGDYAVVARHDYCAYLGLAMVKGRNMASYQDTGDPALQNGLDDFYAIRYDPEQFVTNNPSTVFQIDKVEVLLTEPFMQGKTLPEVLIVGNHDTGASGDPLQDYEPDMNNILAQHTNLAVNFAVDSGNDFEWAWVEIPNLAGTLITDYTQPFWVVFHLPPYEVSGLPFDCGTLKNCPDYINQQTGELEMHNDFRYRHFKSFSADDPDAPNEWLGPIYIGCSDGVSGVWINAPVNITISDVTASNDDLMLWNQTIIDAIIKCSPDGVFNEAFSAGSRCPDPAQLSKGSDISFLADWIVNGLNGVPLSGADWAIWDVTADPTHSGTPVFETGTYFNAYGYANCEETNPDTWQPGAGRLDWPDPANPGQYVMALIQLSGYETVLTWQSWRFDVASDYEACLAVLHRHCDASEYSPDPDEYELDNYYDGFDPGQLNHYPCIQFSLQGCDMTIINFDLNSLRAWKGDETLTHLKWETDPPGDPQDYAVHVIIWNKDQLPTLHSTAPRSTVSTQLTYDLTMSVADDTPLYIKVYEYSPACGSKPDP